MAVSRRLATVLLAGAVAGAAGFAIVGCSINAAVGAAPGVMHPLPNDRTTTVGPRERLSLDDGWRFTKGDPQGLADGVYNYFKTMPTNNSPTNALEETDFAQELKRTGEDLRQPGTPPPPAAAAPANAVADAAYAHADFDDGGWRSVDLPHDWAVEGPFEANLPGGTGRLQYAGAVWYRRHLDLPAADAGKQLYLDIDGAMSYALVWINGQFAGGWPYGYSSFRIDMTPFLKPGQDNTIAIRLDSPDRASRWYPGAGMYRNVWLVKTNPVHVAHWGTAVTTPQPTEASATVQVKAAIDNDGGASAQVTVTHRVYALGADGMRAGAPLAETTVRNVEINAHASADTDASMKLAAPRLWDLDHPQNRYVVNTTVEQDGNVLDSYDSPFGVRSVVFDPNKGLLLNGKHVPIQGVCDHHDLGALGSAVNARALERQLQELKEMGCNAIRTSHNPPAPELLDLADRLGFMVMDETFDCWEKGKNPGDYHLFYPDWHEKDTRALVRRDRNHPSVIMWSVGNEVPDQGSGEHGVELAKELTNICHQEDPTRPTGSANNNPIAGNGFNPFHTGLDLMGINYNTAPRATVDGLNVYQRFHQAFPDQFVFGSETASTVSSREFYSFPVAEQPGSVTGGGFGGFGGRGRGGRGGRGGQPGAAPATRPAIPGQDGHSWQVSDYDLYYPSWAQSPDTEFAALEKAPFTGGEFVWTGFDYLGEPTPFGGRNDTARSSYFGIIDLAGFKKDRFYEYQAHWRPDLPMAHILPHWNWPDRVGQVTPVHIFTSGDEAELFLNGVSQGRKKKGPYEYRIRFDNVVYQPGELHVVAYKDGKKWAEDTVKTTGAPAALAATPDRAAIAADGKDLSFVTINVNDSAGLTVPTATNLIKFTLTGPGQIVATDNGDATDMSIFHTPERSAFGGKALAIIRATGPGTITLHAESENLQGTSATITAAK
ncbi:MAG TPA: glycoside hydrolase family 2 TIM barrel-domain containing protein [Phycisphaerae bacterium]|nr:glycoside hydrolase family 2 TIM barrel-domain containing protein [Phycisphaerae bacterium]